MEEDLTYNDSLNFHFIFATALWSQKLDQEVFETLTSSDLNIISIDSLKKQLVNYYSFAKRTFDIIMNRYANIIEEASRNTLNTRFNALWNNTWNDPDYENNEQRDMKPINYESLKKVQEFKYFLNSLKNQLFWYVISPLNEANEKAGNLISQINTELIQLEK